MFALPIDVREVADGIAEVGEDVIIRRLSTPRTEVLPVTVPARLSGYTAEELPQGVQQGDVICFIAHQSLVDEGFPVPLLKGDQIVTKKDGRTATFDTVETRSVGNTPAMYVCIARGFS